jgi:hypothetical protein
MEDRVITYRFGLPRNEDDVSVTLHFDPDTMLLRPRKMPSEAPAWTALDFNQCGNCPLQAQEHPRCPAAAHLAAIVPGFEPVVSFDEMRVEVTTPERTVVAATTAQQALSSLIGLVMATSGCPRTRFFRLMARFHLPLATEDETTFRAVGAWLTRDLLQEGSVERADLEGLADIYRHLRMVNVAMTRRLNAAGRTDSTINAVVLLDVFAMTVPRFMDYALESYQALLD